MMLAAALLDLVTALDPHPLRGSQTGQPQHNDPELRICVKRPEKGRMTNTASVLQPLSRGKTV